MSDTDEPSDTVDQQHAPNLGACGSLPSERLSSLSVQQQSTERFGPVLVVKNEGGKVVHVEQAHPFSEDVRFESQREAQRTLAEIERQANLVPPSPKYGADITGELKLSTRSAGEPYEESPVMHAERLSQLGVQSFRTGASSTTPKRPSPRLEEKRRLEPTEMTPIIFKSPVAAEEVTKSDQKASFNKSNSLTNGLIVSEKSQRATPENNTAKGETLAAEDIDVVKDEESSLQAEDELYEFGNFETMNRCTRMFYSIERDIFNWYGSFLSLISHGWGFESFLCLTLSVGSTCFFCYYRTADGEPLAARLDFSIIGSALVFPVTFLIAETFRRREGAIQRLASIKATLCQIELGLLNWRWKGPNNDMGVEWEDRVHETLDRIINTMCAILKLPTWNTNRHIYTRQGREFKARVIKRERELTRRLGLLFSELHWYVEDVKASGLPGNEASRLNQYNSMLQIDFEALAMVKSYRTPNVSRSFVRIMVLVMPIFYGPYFAWVSGAIGAGGQTNIAFAIALTVVTVIVLLGLVRVQRAMEDPFTSHFPGDVIDLVSEQLDTETRLNLIVACSRERKRIRAAAALAASANNSTA